MQREMVHRNVREDDASVSGRHHLQRAEHLGEFRKTADDAAAVKNLLKRRSLLSERDDGYDDHGGADGQPYKMLPRKHVIPPTFTINFIISDKGEYLSFCKLYIQITL